MAVKTLTRSSLTNNAFYRSMLAGNPGEVEGEILLAETLLSSAAASVTFNSLATYAAQGYQHLQLRIVTRTNRNGADSDPVVLRFNGDSGANYATHGLIGYNFGASNAVAANSGTSTNHLFLSEAMPVSNSSAGSFGVIITDILDPFETKNKTVRSLAGMKDAWGSAEIRSGLWMNTTSVNSITILPLLGTEFAQYSRFSLYGSK